METMDILKGFKCNMRQKWNWNLICFASFLETVNYCYPTVFKTTKVDLVTFYKCMTTKCLVISR